MEFFTNFIDWFKNIIDTVWGFVTGYYENLFRAYKYIGSAIKLGYDLLTSLPEWLVAFGTVTIGVSIVFTVLGWSTGGDKFN